MKSHTPGPWEAIGRSVYTQGEPAQEIVHVCKGFDIERARANAQLIAAAPELEFLLNEAVNKLDENTAGAWMLEAKAVLEELRG